MPTIKNSTYKMKCLWLLTATQLSTQGQWLGCVSRVLSHSRVAQLTGLLWLRTVRNAGNAYYEVVFVSYRSYKSGSR